MRFVLPTRPIARSAGTTVRDPGGNARYSVSGQVLRLGGDLAIRDVEADSAALAIRRQLFALRRTFEIHRDGELFAIARREVVSFFRSRCAASLIGTDGGDDFVAEGDFAEREYAIRHRERGIAARVSTELAGDEQYGIEVKDDEDEAFILAFALAVDLIAHSASLPSERAAE